MTGAASDLFAAAEAVAEGVLEKIEDSGRAVVISHRRGEGGAPADPNAYAAYVAAQNAAVVLAVEILSMGGMNLLAIYRPTPKGIDHVGRGAWLIDEQRLTETERRAQR